MKRFVLRDWENNVVLKSDTLIDIYKLLKSFTKKQLSMPFIVCDLEDDLFIDAYELIEAFDRGETPEDLQFF